MNSAKEKKLYSVLWNRKHIFLSPKNLVDSLFASPFTKSIDIFKGKNKTLRNR